MNPEAEKEEKVRKRSYHSLVEQIKKLEMISWEKLDPTLSQNSPCKFDFTYFLTLFLPIFYFAVKLGGFWEINNSFIFSVKMPLNFQAKKYEILISRTLLSGRTMPTDSLFRLTSALVWVKLGSS